MQTPSSPAAADGLANALARRARLFGWARQTRLILILAAAAFVTVEAVSLGLWAVGTETCDEEGFCARTEWHPQHLQPRSRTELLHGERNGMHVEYYRDGSIHFVGVYDEGVRAGPWREYWPGGSPRFEGTYEGDRLVGAERWWYSNGNLEAEVTREDGKRQGVETWYHANGALRRAGRFEAGEPRGVFRVFHEDGSEAFSVDHDDI